MPTAAIAERFLAGESVASLVEDFGVTSELAEQAIRHEQVSRAA